MCLPPRDARQEALAELPCFRGEFYSCLAARSDALFELADAVLCGDGPVRSPAELSLVGEHRRGHGALYAAIARGRVDTGRLRRALAAVPLPRAAHGRLVLAIDITCWLRPRRPHVTAADPVPYLRPGQGPAHPGPHAGPARSSVPRVGPQLMDRAPGRTPPGTGADSATVTARQLRDLLERLIAAGRWQAGDPDILVAADVGYDAPRLAFLLGDLPAQVLATCSTTAGGGAAVRPGGFTTGVPQGSQRVTPVNNPRRSPRGRLKSLSAGWSCEAAHEEHGHGEVDGALRADAQVLVVL